MSVARGRSDAASGYRYRSDLFYNGDELTPPRHAMRWRKTATTSFACSATTIAALVLLLLLLLLLYDWSAIVSGMK